MKFIVFIVNKFTELFDQNDLYAELITVIYMSIISLYLQFDLFIDNNFYNYNLISLSIIISIITI